MKTSTVLVLLLAVVSACVAQTCDTATFLGGKFSRCQVLNDKYNLYWSIQGEDITMGLHLHDTNYNGGWLGCGISVNGGMMGADIAVVRKKNGVYVLEDRFATQFDTPQVDALQNLNLINITTSDTDGTIVIYSRKLVPCDAMEDQPILEDATQVVFAFGMTTSTGDIQYHNNNRGTAIVYFHNAPTSGTLPPDTQVLNITIPSYAMPSKDTTYTCVSSILPYSSKVHLVRYRPIIAPGNAKYIHHMVLFVCPFDTNKTVPYECGMAPSNCVSVLIAWTIGQYGDDYMGDYALPMGPGTGVQYIVLQMHYNNPDMDSGVIDTSGISLYSTAGYMRTYDVGIVPMALQMRPNLAIPPQMQEYHLYTQCYGECTKSIPAEGITMITWFPHMHQLGSKIWMQHYRDGVELPNIHRDDHYDFARQQNYPIKRKIMPGDTLRLNCVWNSMSKTNITYGGESSSEEMCIGLFQYYPKTTNFMRCTDYHNYPAGYFLGSSQYSICTLNNSVKAVNNSNTLYTPVMWPPAGGVVELPPIQNTCPTIAPTQTPTPSPTPTPTPTPGPTKFPDDVTSAASVVCASFLFAIVFMLAL